VTDPTGFVVGSLYKDGRGAHAGEMDSFYLIERCGQEGRRWVERYSRSKCAGLVRKIDSALMSLRGRKREVGKRLLAEAEADLESYRSEPPSVFHVLEHLYYGVLAYAYYCDEDFEGSTRCVGLAEESLAKALDGRAFLVPLAARFLDFGFQKIRIARNRQRWTEMRECVDRVRGMLADSIPLCVLDESNPIYLHTLIDFYHSVDLESGDRRFIDDFFGEKKRMADFEKAVHKIYVLAGPVIPYP
jgi:hypothetical protein